ncbi:MAG: hypothetical protein IT385_22840 [Deltaproteobacteria bacterium]|nr:hypothetical protein [Deltaproteobacteria bacterium]
MMCPPTRLPILALAVLAAIGASAPPPALAAPDDGPKRVAILPFDSASADPAHAPLGTGLQAMLTTDLAQAAAFTLVERSRLAEIQQELALATTAAIDPATAARVGKLAGATHLVAGAVTVAGKTMRIDARLFRVDSGEVIVTAAIEGDKEAFFELEKQLVQRIVDGTQAQLTPKERAKIARIHTSDFGAFERFSAGVRAFDRAAYDEAMAALREAAALDSEFELARLTLDDYQGILAKLSARAERLDAGQRRAKLLAANARAREQQQIIDRLWEISKGTGLDRLAALYQLAIIHGDIESGVKNDLEIRRFEDQFALDRTSDQLCKTYFAEAVKAWPKAPLFISADYGFNVPIEAAKYAEDSARWLAEFFGKRDRTETWQFHDALLDDMQRHREFASRLHLDAAGHARMVQRAYELGLKLDPDAIDARGSGAPQHWRRGMTQTLGSLYRDAGLLDESTKYFAESGRFSHEPWAVNAAAQEVARNKEAKAFLDAHPSPLVREWVVARGFDITGASQDWRERVVKDLSKAPYGVKGRAALVSGRELRRGGDFRYVLIGEIPIFPIADAIVQTGPRSDPRRAASFDYYRGPSKSAEEEPMLVMADARRGGKLEAGFELRFSPAADWWHDSLSSSAADLAAAGFHTTRPELVFMFGVEDVDVAPVEDPKERNRDRLQRGLRGFGLTVDGEGVALVEVEEPEVQRGLSLARYRLQHKALATAALPGGERLAVSVTVDGTKVTAKIGGKTLTATLSRPADGFAGFAFRRPGFVAIDGLKLTYR